MTEDPYHQPPQRNVIQIERKENGDWIVWNWNTAAWDVKLEPHKRALSGR